MPEPVPGVDDESGAVDGEFASRLESLDGTSLTFVSLGTPNSRELYEALTELLTTEGGVSDVEYYEKAHFSRTLTDEDVETITEGGTDGVIEGFALCGSCNSSSSVDAIAFESHGIPTVQIISDDFLDLNRKIADSYGYDQLPLVTVPQSTKYLDVSEVEDVSAGIKSGIVSMLTCSGCVAGTCSRHETPPVGVADD